MSIFNYLQLQPVEPQDDGTISDLDRYDEDEVIDLSSDVDGAILKEEWDRVLQDYENDGDKINFSPEE